MPEPDIAIRPGRADEEPARSLLDGFVTELEGRYGHFDPKAGPPATAEDMSPPGGAFLLVYVGDEAVACGGVKRLGLGTCEIKRMFVAPAARRRSLSRVLLDALENATRDLGYARVPRHRPAPARRQACLRHLRLPRDPRLQLQPVRVVLVREGAQAGWTDVADRARVWAAVRWRARDPRTRASCGTDGRESTTARGRAGSVVGWISDHQWWLFLAVAVSGSAALLATGGIAAALGPIAVLLVVLAVRLGHRTRRRNRRTTP